MNNKIKFLLLLLGIISLAAVGISVVTHLSSQTKIAQYLKSQANLEKQNTYLKEKLDSSLQDATHWREKSDELTASLTALGKEHTLLERQFEVMLKEKDSILEQNKELSEKAEKLGQAYLETKEVVEQDAPSDEFLSKLLEEKANLEFEMTKLRNKIADQKEKLKDLEEQRLPFERLQKEKQALEGKLSDAEGTSGILSRDLLKIRKEKTSIKGELALAEERLRVLSKENDDLSGQLAVMKQALQRRLNELKQTKLVLESAVEGAASAIKRTESPSIELPPIVVRAEEDGPMPIMIPSVPAQIKEEVLFESAPTELTGTIITINDKHKFVVIDIGRTDGVEQGMVFDVLRKGKKIGKIEVIETRKNIAACDVKEITAKRFKVSDSARR